jgi:UDP-N-acetylglucosamine acyltransferase
MNIIHPTSIITPEVVLGDNNYIGPHCYITGNTTIGDNNRFEGFCSIGTPAQHTDYFTSTVGKVIIGNNNIIREYVSIHAGTKNVTTLCNDIIILNHSHIAHDVYLENKTIISANVTLAGHCYIMEGANIALNSTIHQFQIIGAYSMIGMGGIVTKTSNIIPGNIYVGSPIKYLKSNKIGLERNNITKEKLDILIKKYNNLKNVN